MNCDKLSLTEMSIGLVIGLILIPASLAMPFKKFSTKTIYVSFMETPTRFSILDNKIRYNRNYEDAFSHKVIRLPIWGRVCIFQQCRKRTENRCYIIK